MSICGFFDDCKHTHTRPLALTSQRQQRRRIKQWRCSSAPGFAAFRRDTERRTTFLSVVHPTESVSRGQNFVTTDGHDAARRREAKTPRDKSACYDGDDDDYYYEQQTVRTTRPLLSWPALLSLGAISLSRARCLSLSGLDQTRFVRFRPVLATLFGQTGSSR